MMARSSKWTWLRVAAVRFMGLFGKRNRDWELEEELRAHFDSLAEENIRRGMKPEEAQFAARREFGGVEQTKQIYRDQRSLPFLEALLQDLRFGLRSLRKHPGFAGLAILTLALGISVNTSLFTVVHGVLLSPLPFPDPERLMSLFERAVGNEDGSDNVVAGGQFADWQRQATSFEQMALVSEASANLSGDGGSLPEAIGTRLCSYNLFSILGVRAIYGRLFSAEDDREGASATVVLTYGLWKRRYAGEPATVGKTILLDTKPYTVIGVLPAWFDYPDTRVQVWLPVYHEVPAEDMRSRSNHRFFVTARLKRGVSAAQAYAELDAIEQRIHQQNPDTIAGKHATVIPLIENLVRDVRTSLYVLMGAVSCVLLIACLNVANLFVARAATRRRETAVRAALGGSRLRLMREQLTESLLLTFLGGALGVSFAYTSIRWLVALRGDLPRANSIHLDPTALLFTIAITVVSGIFAGVLPAFFGTRSDLLAALKENVRSLGGGQTRARLRTFLLTVEVSLTVVLLIGAGLLLKSFAELRSVKMGCATADVLTMGLSLPEAKYQEGAQKARFLEDLLARVRATPGVSAAGFVTVVPGGGHFEDNTFRIDGHPQVPGQFLDATVRGADPDYFRAMNIPVLRGRYFLDSDRRQNSNGMVISESMAKKFFANEDPIGQALVVEWQGEPRFEIVGIIGDVISDLARPPEPTMYVPLNFGRFGYGSLVVRSTRDVTALALPVQKEIAALDSDLPVSDVLTMEQVIGKSASGARFDAVLVLLFAVLALILAAVGLYGLLSYLVTQRTSEIGIRVALGARRPAVLQMMLLDGLRPTVIGLLLGLMGGAISSQLIRSVLFGVRPLDLTIFVLVALVVLAVALAASFFPSWRASRLDPVAALHCE
jgi:predicted permease